MFFRARLLYLLWKIQKRFEFDRTSSNKTCEILYYISLPLIFILYLFLWDTFQTKLFHQFVIYNGRNFLDKRKVKLIERCSGDNSNKKFELEKNLFSKSSFMSSFFYIHLKEISIISIRVNEYLARGNCTIRGHSTASLEKGGKKKWNGILVVPFPGRSHVSYGHGCAFVAKANRGAQLKRET